MHRSLAAILRQADRAPRPARPENRGRVENSFEARRKLPWLPVSASSATSNCPPTGKPIVLHDATLDRLTARERSARRAGRRRSRRNASSSEMTPDRGGGTIPTLPALLTAPDRADAFRWSIEIKGDEDPEPWTSWPIERVVDLTPSLPRGSVGPEEFRSRGRARVVKELGHALAARSASARSRRTRRTMHFARQISVDFLSRGRWTRSPALRAREPDDPADELDDPKRVGRKRGPQRRHGAQIVFEDYRPDRASSSR